MFIYSFKRFLCIRKPKTSYIRIKVNKICKISMKYLIIFLLSFQIVHSLAPPEYRFLEALSPLVKDPLTSESLEKQYFSLQDFSKRLPSMLSKLQEKQVQASFLRETEAKEHIDLEVLKEKLKTQENVEKSAVLNEKFLDSSKIFQGILEKIENSLGNVNTKLKEAKLMSSEKKEMVLKEIQQITEQNKDLAQENNKLFNEYDREKEIFQNNLRDLEALDQESKDFSSKFQMMKAKLDGSVQRKYEIERKNKELMDDYSKMDGKIQDLARKTQKIGEKNQGLRLKLGFFRKMIQKSTEEINKKNTSLRELSSQIKDIDYKTKRSSLELKAKQNEREAILSQLEKETKERLNKLDMRSSQEKKEIVDKKQKIESLEALAKKIGIEVKKIEESQ